MSRFDTLAAKRERLLHDQRSPRRFGKWWTAWTAHHERFGCARPAVVAEIERAHGVQLPADYRRFVVEIADGGMGPGEAMWSVDQGTGEAGGLIGPLATPFLTSLAAHPDDDHAQPTGCLVLTHTGCGCLDLLAVTGPERGQVWFYDRNVKPLKLDFLDWYERFLDDWLA